MISAIRYTPSNSSYGTASLAASVSSGSLVTNLSLSKLCTRFVQQSPLTEKKLNDIIENDKRNADSFKITWLSSISTDMLEKPAISHMSKVLFLMSWLLGLTTIQAWAEEGVTTTAVVIEIGGKTIKPSVFKYQSNKLIDISENKEISSYLRQVENSTSVVFEGCPPRIVSENIGEQVKEVLNSIRTKFGQSITANTHILASSGVLQSDNYDQLKTSIRWHSGRDLYFITPTQELQYRLETIKYNLIEINNGSASNTYPIEDHLLVDIGSSNIKIGLIRGGVIRDGVVIPYGTKSTAKCGNATRLGIDRIIEQEINKMTLWLNNKSDYRKVVFVGGAPYFYFQLNSIDLSKQKGDSFFNDARTTITPENTKHLISELEKKPSSPNLVFSQPDEQYAALKWIWAITEKLQVVPTAFPLKGGSSWTIGYAATHLNK